MGFVSSKQAAQILLVAFNDEKKKVKIRIILIFLLIVSRSPANQSDDVTVYFHAILSKDFKLNPETHKVFIKAGGISHCADWKDNICELSCTKYVPEPRGALENGVRCCTSRGT